MGHIVYSPKVESLNRDLLKLLDERNADAIKVIDKLKREGFKEKDNNLIGYAYYRYAYYYYFTSHNLELFHKSLQMAIKYLLRSDNKEYLGGAYNLVAYDALDLGCFDVAYAYYRLAHRASKEVEGIALPLIIEANAGRLLLEMGDARKGRAAFRRAAKGLEKFKSLHVFHYNMVITYADEALASFVLRDLDGVEKVNKKIKKHFEEANDDEKALCRSYLYIAKVFYDLLKKDVKSLNDSLKKLLKDWKVSDANDLVGLTFEIEELFRYMMDEGYLKQIKQLLDASQSLQNSENLSVVMKYYAMCIFYDKQVNDATNLKEHLYLQHKTQKRQLEDSLRLKKYAIEFADMIVNISDEQNKAREENKLLQIQANTDSLTKLPNRNAMNKRLAQMFEEAEERGESFGIGIIDIDYFKDYNDTFGHQAGDECLKRIGEVLSTFIKDDLFCARYGGDEFVIGYYGYKDSQIKKLAAKMQEEVASKSMKHSKGKLEIIQISQGFYNKVPKNKDKLWDFLSEADKRLYEIKKSKNL